MTEFISDGKFMAMRAELQEQSMLLREILKALQSSRPEGSRPAATSAKPEAKAPPTPKVPKEAVGTATVETLTGQAVEQVDTGKPYPWGTPQDAPDAASSEPLGYGSGKTPAYKTEPVEMAVQPPSVAEEAGAQPPIVPRRGQTQTGSTNR